MEINIQFEGNFNQLYERLRQWEGERFTSSAANSPTLTNGEIEHPAAGNFYVVYGNIRAFEVRYSIGKGETRFRHDSTLITVYANLIHFGFKSQFDDCVSWLTASTQTLPLAPTVETKPQSATTPENILEGKEVFKGDPKTFRSIIKAYKKTLSDDSGMFRLLGEDDDNYQRIEIKSHFRVHTLIASIPPTREAERERALPYGSCVLSAQVTPQGESKLKIEKVYRDWRLVEPKVSRLLEYLQSEDWLRGKGISVGDVLAHYEKMTPEEEEKINRDFLQSLRPSPIALAMTDDSEKRRREIEAQEAMIKIAEMLDKQIRDALSNKEKPTEQETEEDTPTWANEAWYTALAVDERQRYLWLRPFKERWEMGEMTDNELARELGKSVDTIRRWRRNLEKKNCPDMDWQRPT